MKSIGLALIMLNALFLVFSFTWVRRRVRNIFTKEYTLVFGGYLLMLTIALLHHFKLFGFDRIFRTDRLVLCGLIALPCVIAAHMYSIHKIDAAYENAKRRNAQVVQQR